MATIKKLGVWNNTSHLQSLGRLTLGVIQWLQSKDQRVKTAGNTAMQAGKPLGGKKSVSVSNCSSELFLQMKLRNVDIKMKLA